MSLKDEFKKNYDHQIFTPVKRLYSNQKNAAAVTADFKLFFNLNFIHCTQINLLSQISRQCISVDKPHNVVYYYSINKP
ncbi:MAG: hypothetical protein PF690_06155 [Deltaproteobacteria bacterium]|jgi:hypothetical protein|nr:hypothetical protein [Deltaproteobacteria bacterium]